MIDRLVPAVCLALCLTGNGAAADGVQEPDGYRMSDYRASVPESLAGARVLDTPAARALWEAGDAVFVDVLPSPPRPGTLPAGTLWQEPSRDTIPGATWLPNTGFGLIAPETDAYLHAHLERLIGGDPDRAVVFFCLADCWMSWNAARRAVVEYGMGGVHWYPHGTTGWEAAGLPLEKVRAAE